MKRYNTTDNGYVYDKFIFWFVMLLTVGGVFLIAARHDFKFSSTYVYIQCKGIQDCPNPLIENDEKYLQDCRQQLRILFFIPLYTTKDCKESCTEDWCNWEMLPPGNYGTPPDPWVENYLYVVLGLILVGIVANHFIHNRGRKFQIQLSLNKKTRDWIKNKFGGIEDAQISDGDGPDREREQGN